MPYIKIDNQNQVVYPPVNDGNHVNVFLDRDWCLANGYDKDWTEQQIEQWQTDHPKPATVEDYDRALEAHLTAERTARGYTTREPDYYINSSVARWKQDALDWVAHRDAVMLYGLEIENKFEAGETVPTLSEFKAALPKITWTIEVTE